MKSVSSKSQNFFIDIGRFITGFLEKHLDGVISYAEYPISNGKVEGINQKIKTIRRKIYGLPDDEYFLIKLFDASRQR